MSGFSPNCNRGQALWVSTLDAFSQGSSREKVKSVEPPRLIVGDPAEDLQTIATERHLKFGIDFGTGYSPGLFLDQRENRRYVRHIAPKRLLNCFAYTCSFSVSAAYVGAATLNIDLSKKSLSRGRENFALNCLPTIEHRFIADDVSGCVTTSRKER